MFFLKPALAFVVFVTAALAQAPASFTVVFGDKKLTLSAADFRQYLPQTISAIDHGARATFTGVLLRDVLTKAGVPAGDTLKGEALALYVVAEGRDGYKAVFALPEMDPAFTERKVYVVVTRDGKPLSEKEGPFRLIVPDDKQAKRWVSQLQSVRVGRAAQD